MTTGSCQYPGCAIDTNGVLCPRHQRGLKAAGSWFCSNPGHQGDRILPRSYFRSGPAGWRTRPDCGECERRMARAHRAERSRQKSEVVDIRRRLLTAAAIMEQRELQQQRVRLMAGNLRWMA